VAGEMRSGVFLAKMRSGDDEAAATSVAERGGNFG